MSTITGLPSTNVASVTPELYVSAMLKKIWGNFYIKTFTSNEIVDQLEGMNMGDVVNVKMKPILPEAEIITNISTGPNTYQVLNYGKLATTLDFALSSKYQWQNAQTTINPLEFDQDGAEASADAMARAYEREIMRRIRTLVLTGSQVIGTVGTAMNLRALRNVRLEYDKMLIPASETVYVACNPQAFDEMMNIPEFVNKMDVRGVDTELPVGVESFAVGFGLNMVFVKTYYIDRPTPATDPIAYTFTKKSIVTPMRPVRLSGTGVDIVKKYNSLSMTHSLLPVSDQRLGVSVMQKDEAVCGFATVPWDINASGVTSGISVCHLRGGV